MSKATELKGTYNLNPTSQIMKQGSREARMMHERHSEDYPARGRKGSRAGGEMMIDGDMEGVEHRELEGHSAMKTRLHHHKHNDGERKVTEDHHHAVRAMKGKI